MSNFKKDVIVVGAGPSGSRLAFRLAERGYQVLVLERKAAAGDEVCCTGIVSRECLDSFAIDRGLVSRPASSARFVSPSGQYLRLWRDGEVAFILDRPALDRALAKRAQEAGAEYIFNMQVTDIHVETDRVRIKAVCGREIKDFVAEVAALATGFGSTLPERLGLGMIGDVTVGAQAGVRVNEVGEVEIYFDQTLAPGGYAWLVPTADDRGLAGLLTRRQPQSYLSRLLSHLQAQGKIASADVETGYGAIPLRPLPATCAERILVLGEAAGQVKPATGGGIYYGLLCADIAAETLEQALAVGDFSAAGLSYYDRQWRARLGRELRAGRWLLRFYRTLGNRQIDWLFRIMRSNGVPQFVADLDTLPFDWHGALAIKLIKHLAANAPLRAARSLRGR